MENQFNFVHFIHFLENKNGICIREALVTVLEINDFKQRGFIALEIFFINHNSYMIEMHTDSID